MPTRKLPVSHVRLTSRWRRRDGKLGKDGSPYLSEAQQRRYENAGVSQKQYRDKNFNLAAPRGHGGTPEKKLVPAKATQAQRERYPGYFGRREGAVYVLSTDGVKEFARIEMRPSDEKMIGGHWNKIGRALRPDDELAQRAIATFKGIKVGGYGSVPRMELEYRLDVIQELAGKAKLPDKPFTIGS